ncbi:MAG: heavy metal translocating P-type ATPase, partial [Rubrivivax sp.]
MTNKLKLDIPLLLPQIEDAGDAIVRRLVQELTGRDGVAEVHVVPAQGSTPPQLCVHHEPDVLPLARIRELVQAAGAQISERFAHVIWHGTGIGHARRARTVGEHLRQMPGVLDAQASASGQVHIDFDRQATSEQALRTALS